MRSTIICVDDEKMILNILADQLEGWFGSNYEIERALGAEEALEILDDHMSRNKDVSCVISDYIMPNMKGDELLEKVKIRDDKIKKIMLTGYSSIEGIISAINRAGLYRYITKPWDSRDLMLTIVEAIKSYEQTKDAARVSSNFHTMYKKYEQLYIDLDLSYKASIEAMVKILELQDPSCKGRSKRVSNYATLLATKKGFRDDELRHISMSAMLHNIGRTILTPEQLNSDNEAFVLKQQIFASEQILSHMPDAEKILPSIKYQFETFSGNGVLKLSDDKIPTEAKILSICSHFDLLRNRTEPALSRDDIIKQLNQSKYTLFDPPLVDAFIQVIIDKDL